MKFILTRHGEKQHVESIRYEDYFNASLSETGIGQIQLLANYLKTKFPELVRQKYVYSSHMPRSIQTAEILRQIIGTKEIFIYSALQEFFGSNTMSLPMDERRAIHLKALENPDFVPADVGRSFNQALSDFRVCLELIAKENQNEYILISGHGMITRCFIYTFAPELKPAPEVFFENGSKAGGYSVVEYKNGKFSLLEYNQLPNFN